MAAVHRVATVKSCHVAISGIQFSSYIHDRLLLLLSSRLDPILYRKCQGDAARLCYTQGWNETNENAIPTGAVFSCLYRHAYRSVDQGRRVSLVIFIMIFSLWARRLTCVRRVSVCWCLNFVADLQMSL